MRQDFAILCNISLPNALTHQLILDHYIIIPNIFLSFLQTLGISSKDLYVSPDGQDQPACGEINNTCRTIKFTTEERANPDDKINIDGKFSSENTNAVDMQEVTVNKSLTFQAFNGGQKLGSSKQYLEHCFFKIYSLALHPQIDVKIKNISFYNICIATIKESHVIVESCRAESNINHTAIKMQNKATRAVSVKLLNSAFIGTSGIFGDGIKFQGVLLQIINSSFFRNHFGILLNIHRTAGVNISIYNSTFHFISSYALAYHPIDTPYFNQVQIYIKNSTFVRNGRHKMLDWSKPCGSISIGSAPIKNYLRICSKLQGPLTKKLLLFIDECKFLEGDLGISVKNINVNIIQIDINKSVFHHLMKTAFLYDYSFSPSTLAVTIKVTNSDFLGNGNPNVKWKGLHLFQPKGGVSIRGGSSNLLTHVLIGNSTFTNNHAQMSGGAVFIDKANTTILNCTFAGNYAGLDGDKIDQYSFRAGGAIFLGADCSARILNCSMKGNYAWYGSAVFQHFGYNPNTLELIDIKILSSNFSRVLWLGAVEYLPYSKVNIRNMIIQCPEQSNIKLQKSLSYNFAAECNSCPENEYTLNAGTANISFQEGVDNSIISATPADCHECPFGAVCKKGQIKAKSNFWKYFYNERAYFLICPTFYCKVGDEVETANHSCINSRKGTLCGTCREEFTETLFSSLCIQKGLCKPHLFWLILLAVSLFYLLFLMFLPEISQFLNRFLRFPCSRPFAKRMSLIAPLLSANERQEIQDNGCQPDETNPSDTSIVKGNPRPSSKDPAYSMVAGIIKVMSFYYQVDILFNFYENKPNKNVISSIKQALYSIFNLSPAPSGSNLSALGCPFYKMNVLYKYLMRSLLPLSIFILAGVSYSAQIVTQYIRQRWLAGRHLYNPRNKSLQTRLLCSILQIIILSYSMITSNLFSLVTCVSMENGKKILFVDGNIQCYRWWQHTIIAFIVIWVFPLGISLFTATNLLKRRCISVKEFFLSLIIPLPMNVIFIVRHFLYGSFQGETKTNTGTNDNNIAGDTTSTEGKLLFILQGPFQKSNSIASHLYWDAVLILQRLILLIMHAFIINPIGKAYSMSITLIFFFGYHLRIFPFQSMVLNVMQAITLFFVCVNSGINIFDAYTYVHGTHISGLLATVSNIFSIIVTLMHLFFPVLIAFIVICVIIVHSVSLIFQCLRSLI